MRSDTLSIYTSSMSSFLYNHNSKFGKSIHLPDSQVLKSAHPATKMCTPGAGCTLNFEHCSTMIFFDCILVKLGPSLDELSFLVPKVGEKKMAGRIFFSICQFFIDYNIQNF